MMVVVLMIMTMNNDGSMMMTMDTLVEGLCWYKRVEATIVQCHVLVRLERVHLVKQLLCDFYNLVKNCYNHHNLYKSYNDFHCHNSLHFTNLFPHELVSEWRSKVKARKT